MSTNTSLNLDPYSHTKNCVDRLILQYHQTPRLILAVDCDETVYDFHQKGYHFPQAIDLLKRAQALGFYIVIFTASSPARYQFMRDYLELHGIRVDSINTNPISELSYGLDRAKIFYNILLDDRAGLGQAMEILDQLLTYVEQHNELTNITGPS